MALMRGVKAKCRNCGREADAGEFALDSFFRMVVCPNCVKERKAKGIAASIQKRQPETAPAHEASRPAGWDEDDDYLERTSKLKGKSTVRATRIDDERVKFKCPKCSYGITYNTVKKIPGRCPYCSLSFKGPAQ